MRFSPDEVERAGRAGLTTVLVLAAIIFAGLPAVAVLVHVIMWVGQ